LSNFPFRARRPLPAFPEKDPAGPRRHSRAALLTQVEHAVSSFWDISERRTTGEHKSNAFGMKQIEEFEKKLNELITDFHVFY
jgi:hypothetical protein